jgi:hypothetical protein
MAVAGFSQDELEIQYEHQSLTVTGKKQKKDEEVTYLHRGIAARDFKHKFQLADHVKVNSANLENGLLEIHLKREVPEALKPKKIEIESKEKNYLRKKLLNSQALSSIRGVFITPLIFYSSIFTCTSTSSPALIPSAFLTSAFIGKIYVFDSL